MKIPLLLLAKSPVLALVLPFWYLIAYPISELLMQLDMRVSNTTGTGILIVAAKSIDNE